MDFASPVRIQKGRKGLAVSRSEMRSTFITLYVHTPFPDLIQVHIGATWKQFALVPRRETRAVEARRTKKALVV